MYIYKGLYRYVCILYTYSHQSSWYMDFNESQDYPNHCCFSPRSTHLSCVSIFRVWNRWHEWREHLNKWFMWIMLDNLTSILSSSILFWFDRRSWPLACEKNMPDFAVSIWQQRRHWWRGAVADPGKPCRIIMIGGKGVAINRGKMMSGVE